MEKIEIVDDMLVGEKGSLDHCIVRLEEEFLRARKECTVRKRQFVFSAVPKPFLVSGKDFYVPMIVSIGPYHSKTPELTLESHKIEAMRRMDFRLRKMDPVLNLMAVANTAMKDIEKEIRDCYEEDLNYSSEELVWMVTGDACFLYEFVASYCKRVAQIDIETLTIPEDNNDSIFDSSCLNPTWKRILLDLLLFENQIPLIVLEQLLKFAEGVKEKLFEKMIPILISERSVGVFSWSVSPTSMADESPHLLGLFYGAIVGLPRLYGHHGHDVESPGFSGEFSKDFLIPKLPSASELSIKGVKFRCIPPRTDCPPIQCVRFEEKTAILYLPQVHVDNFRIALLRNFIAMEVTNDKYEPYPVTSFAILMNELVDDAEDCRLLSKEKIIVPLLGSDEEVAKAFNFMTNSMEMRLQTCKSVDNVRTGLRKYLKRRERVRWSEFYSTYFSRPWQKAGYTFATLLLLLTMLQVFCSFKSCNA